MRPPPRLRFSAWIEQHLLLSDGVSALPGPVRLWPYQRAIADAIGDPAIECVTVANPVRAGFTQLTACSSLLASPVAKSCNKLKGREKAQCRKAIRAAVKDCKSRLLTTCKSTGSC
jgi:hypothetical protein